MSKQKAKGTRFENDVRDAFERAGFEAERTGKIVGYPGDVEVLVASLTPTTLSDTFGQNSRQRLRIECKRRARAWKDIYDWLDKNETQVLAFRADRKKALAAMPLDYFISLVAELHRLRRQT
jgi:Holliday junction resolvase